jgi:hypothetical protein
MQLPLQAPREHNLKPSEKLKALTVSMPRNTVLVADTISFYLLIPQVRPAHKYPNSPWETIHLPGEIMQYVLVPTRATRLGVPSHSQPLINTKYLIQMTNYLQTRI